MTTKRSPFFLLYGHHLNLLSDENLLCPLDVEVEDMDERIRQLPHGRQQANEATYERALNVVRIRDDIVKPHEFKAGEYVLVRHEGPQKFEAKWYGPYCIDACTLLGTYCLTDPGGKALVNLINGQQLVRAHITGDVTKLWTSPFMKSGVRPANMEERAILDAEGPIPSTYDELATADRVTKRPSLATQVSLKKTTSVSSRKVLLTENAHTAETVHSDKVVEEDTHQKYHQIKKYPHHPHHPHHPKCPKCTHLVKTHHTTSGNAHQGNTSYFGSSHF